MNSASRASGKSEDATKSVRDSGRPGSDPWLRHGRRRERDGVPEPEDIFVNGRIGHVVDRSLDTGGSNRRRRARIGKTASVSKRSPVGSARGWNPKAWAGVETIRWRGP